MCTENTGTGKEEGGPKRSQRKRKMTGMRTCGAGGKSRKREGRERQSALQGILQNLTLVRSDSLPESGSRSLIVLQTTTVHKPYHLYDYY